MRQKLFSITKNDFEFQTFRGSGNGGQNVNKVETCCRMIHKDSGTITLGTEERTQWANKQNAFNKMMKHPKFKAWLKLKTARVLGIIKTPEQIEKEVDESMRDDNLRVEARDKNGKFRLMESEPENLQNW